MKVFWSSRDSCSCGPRRLTALAVVLCMIFQNFAFCQSLNDEGLALLSFKAKVVSDPFGALSNWKDEIGLMNPCSWFGVECSDGIVVALNLKNLCLGGNLAPQLGNLVHIKSIILRNNSFYGVIPEKIAKLKELEMLDLGYNNFSGSLPYDLGNNFSLAILLLDNNELLSGISPETYELQLLSEAQTDEKQLSGGPYVSSCNVKLFSWSSAPTQDLLQRKLLETNIEVGPPPAASSAAASLTPSPAPSPSPQRSMAPVEPIFPPPSTSSSTNSSAPTENPNLNSSPQPESTRNRSNLALILSAAIGGPLMLLLLVIGIFFCRTSRMVTVKPWATGLSGQLQKALVTGIPKLKRSELETACEDFSNVIGSSSAGTSYKGTLSSGVEIAVRSLAVSSAKEWSMNLEVQFRKKIETLSKVNHKNFVNLLGYCEEEETFTRMLVFEYAPNGTLFEHLHIKEAEHLDWGMRMRIAMGIAYCLDHMHQLSPPIAHKNLNSSSVHLTEDYAAKISDFGFWNEFAAAEMESRPEDNVYSFGVILFEMVTGNLPYAVNNGSLEDWASDYLRRGLPLREMVDQTLESFQIEQLESLDKVIKCCVHPDPRHRPTMREVTAILREITGISPEGAVPKLSALWWAELEILSTEAS